MLTQRLLLSLLLALATSFCVNAEELRLPLKLSPVEARISAIEARINAKPTASAYNELAAALCRKGRDTEDLAVYEQASIAIDKSLQLSKANYEARKLQVTILLGKHEFAQALKLATQLNHEVPDDLAGWASLVEANIFLGNYAAAEPQAQWLLDLRPGNTLGFEKSAVLRELFGDIPGAIEFVDESIRRTSPNDTDQRAFLLTQKARLQLVSGYDKEAAMVVQEALQLFPKSQLATEILARIRFTQGNFSDAAALFESRYRAVKSARNLYDWAEALESNGQKAEAADAFQRFHSQAEAESAKPFNANSQLIFFYLDRKHDAPVALALATKMIAERHDCETLDAYAWALYKNGRYSEAKAQIARALSVGVRDPLYFCRAAQIAAKAGDAVAAGNYQKEFSTFRGATCPGEESLIVTSLVGTQANR